MNRITFAVKNFTDKFFKLLRNPTFISTYLTHYVFSEFRSFSPDIYFISYPKCGVTWVRITINTYLNQLGLLSYNDRKFVKLSEGAIIKFDHEQGSWVPAPRRTDRLVFNKKKYKDKKVCFLARHPGDVLVSSWYHLRYRERIYTKSISDFIRDKNLGIQKIVSFMNLWLNNRDIPSEFYLLTYEALRLNPMKEFRGLFSFLGIPMDDHALKVAVENTSFERMQASEKSNKSTDPWTASGASRSDKSLKTRKGKIGGYLEELLPGDVTFLNEFIAEHLTLELAYHKENL